MNKLQQEKNIYYRARRRPIRSNKTQEATRSTLNEKILPVIKRNAVINAHVSLREILKKFNIPCVKRTFGLGILRICCESVIQLDNITLIIKAMLQLCLIKEIGMPLEYSDEMQTLVLFVKTADIESSMILDRVFQKCSFRYNYLLIDIEYPTAAAKKTLIKEVDSMTIMNLIKPDHQDTVRTPMNNASKVIIFVTIIIILLTSILFKS